MAVGDVGLPEIPRFPDGPHGLAAAQLLLDALCLPALVFPVHALLAGPGQLLPGELQLLAARPAHRLAQLAHGGLDLVGVVGVGAPGSLQLDDAAAGVPGGRAGLGRGAGTAQPGVGLQGGVAVPGGGLGQLELFPLGVGLFLGVPDHLGEGGAALLLFFQRLGQQAALLLLLACVLPPHGGDGLNGHSLSPHSIFSTLYIGREGAKGKGGQHHFFPAREGKGVPSSSIRRNRRVRMTAAAAASATSATAWAQARP